MLCTDPRCSLLICGVIYQFAVSITDPQKKIKMAKKTQKRSQAKIFFAHLYRYNYQTFYEKKISHFTIPLKLHQKMGK